MRARPPGGVFRIIFENILVENTVGRRYYVTPFDILVKHP
jgi:hypothetical protein